MIASWRFGVVYLLLLAAVAFVALHEDVSVPVAKPLADIPARLGTWRAVDDVRFSEAVLKQLRPSDYLYRVYADEEGRQVSLYLGYHGGGPDSGPIHSPKHCLPGSGWHNEGEQKVELVSGDQRIDLVQSVYGNGSDKELFLYWFQVKGRTLTGEYALKFAEVTNSILHNRRDSAFIRVSVPYKQSPEVAVALGERFVRDFYPEIARVLPQ